MKISDELFIAFLKQNAGLYGKTHRAIEEQLGIKYSRQAVRERASKFDFLEDEIEDENLELAVDGLHSLLKSENEAIKLKAIEFYLKTKGKKLGYIEKQQIDSNVNHSFSMPVSSWAESETDE